MERRTAEGKETDALRALAEGSRCRDAAQDADALLTFRNWNIIIFVKLLSY